MRINIYSLLLVFILLTVKVTAQPATRKQLAFQVKSSGLADTTKVYITGGISQLGMWNPSSVEMQFMQNKTWSKTIEVDGVASIEYKFTLGSWDREAADANGNPLSNFVINVTGDTTIIHQIPFWKKGGSSRINHGQITGSVKYHKQIVGYGLQPRDVIVWLPPGYDKNKMQRYPVLYMHDGQNIVDPVTSSFGVDWQIDEASDSLIRNKMSKPFIVAGIYNTSDRTREYTPGDGGEAYMKLVVEKIKPLIDDNYRTKPDRKHTFVGGSSAGGLISFMLCWKYSSVFSGAICMSPAFKIMNIDFVKPVLESDGKKNVFFYIDNGGVGLETQLQPGIDAMLDALNSKGYREGKDFVYVSDPGARHFEAAWAKRFPTAILSLLQAGQ